MVTTRRGLIRLGAASLVAAAVVALTSACSREGSASFHAIDITGATYAQGFELPDADGRMRTLQEFQGRITVVFFGYTHCPDVCPATLLELAEVKRRLGADGDRVQGVFITVDPERDTPELLRTYATHFSPDFVALRGTPDQTQALARAFKVHYAKVPGPTSESYTVDHTAGSYVFDAQGRIRLFTRYGTGPDPLLNDLKLLLAGA